MRHGVNFVVDRDLRTLVERMNRLTDEPLLDFDQVQRKVVARDREMANPTPRTQVTAIHAARRYRPDRFTRVAALIGCLTPRPVRLSRCA